MKTYQLNYIATYRRGIRDKGYAILVMCEGKKLMLYLNTYTKLYFKESGYFIVKEEVKEKVKGDDTILISKTTTYNKYHLARKEPNDLVELLKTWEASTTKLRREAYTII